MNFVSFFQAAQDRNSVFDARLADIDLLEAAFERGILLDIFLVFVERRCPDAAQITARQRR